MSRAIAGWKLYYGDGSVVSSKDSTWEAAPSDDVQVLSIYYEETYAIWQNDREEVENFRDMRFGNDYFWQLGNGQVEDIPEGTAGIKKGKELPQEDWMRIYNAALQDTKF